MGKKKNQPAIGSSELYDGFWTSVEMLLAVAPQNSNSALELAEEAFKKLDQSQRVMAWRRLDQKREGAMPNATFDRYSTLMERLKAHVPWYAVSVGKTVEVGPQFDPERDKPYDRFWSAVESFVVESAPLARGPRQRRSLDRLVERFQGMSPEDQTHAWGQLVKRKNAAQPSISDAYKSIMDEVQPYLPVNEMLSRTLPRLTDLSDPRPENPFGPGDRYQITLTRVHSPNGAPDRWAYAVVDHEGRNFGAEVLPTVARAMEAAIPSVLNNLMESDNPPRQVYNFVLMAEGDVVIGKSHAVDIFEPETMMASVAKHLGKNYYHDGVRRDITDAGVGLRYKELVEEPDVVIDSIQIVRDVIDFDKDFQDYIWGESVKGHAIYEMKAL